MDNATFTVLLFSIPLVLLAIMPFGKLRSRFVFLSLGTFVFLAGATLIMAGLFASGMAAGHGGGGSGGWEGLTPFVRWCALGGLLLVVGTVIRPKGRKKFRPTSSEGTVKLKTLREVQSDALQQTVKKDSKNP